jgi:DNA-directed RNA polymerase specialized sigma24 family protein
MPTSNEKTEKLLALLLLHQMKSAPAREKIMQLNLAGFSNVEIADLLQISTVAVSKLLYENKRRSASNS